MSMQMVKRDNSVMINDIVKHIVRNKETTRNALQIIYSIKYSLLH